MVKERRRHKRYNINIGLKSQILRKDKKTKLTEDIPVRTKDISLGGMRLNWPKKWECKTCTKCLGWVFNFGCPLKRDSAREINHMLDREIILNIVIDIKGKEPQKILTRVVWVDKQREAKNNYDLGLNFIDLDRKAGQSIKELIGRKI